MAAAASGLANLGNTCGINSLIQCLAHSGPLRALLASPISGASVLGELRAVLELMSKGTAVAPGGFVRALFTACPWLSPGEQTDLSELWMAVATTLAIDTHTPGHAPAALSAANAANSANAKHAYLAEKAKSAWEGQNKGSEGLWTDMTHGMMIRQTRCLTCQHTCHNFETFSCLWLDMPAATSQETAPQPLNMLEMLSKLLHPETLDEWTCDRCKEKRPAERLARFWRLPPVLVLALKRFSGGTKNTQRVTLAREFGFASDAELHPPPHTPLAHTPSHTPVQYRLTGMANHHGGLQGGHYTATCALNNQWWHFDDLTAMPLPEPHAALELGANPNAYVLFYSRGALASLIPHDAGGV